MNKSVLLLRKLLEALNPEVQQAIDAWTGNDHDTMISYDLLNQPKRLNDLLNNWLASQSAMQAMIYRGIGVSKKDWDSKLSKLYEPNKVVEFKHKESYSMSKEKAEANAAASEGEIQIVFSLYNKSGVDISIFSKYPEEQEVVVQKDAKAKVISKRFKDNVVEITMREV